MVGPLVGISKYQKRNLSFSYYKSTSLLLSSLAGENLPRSSLGWISRLQSLNIDTHVCFLVCRCIKIKKGAYWSMEVQGVHKILCFSLNFFEFSEFCQFCAALVFYLPSVCTHTDIERKQSPENILKSSKKHNI